MNKEIDNLIIEIASMLEDGVIVVGGFGLSQDSANYVMEYRSLEEQKGALKQILPFLILMENNDGLTGKAPSYVLEKLQTADGYDQCYRMLDPKNSLKLLEWLRKWEKNDIYSHSEYDEIRQQAAGLTETKEI